MLRAGQILQLVVVALLALAVVMVQSAGMTIGAKPFNPADVFLNRTTIYAALAVTALLLADKINIRRLARLYGWHNPVAWTLAASLLLVLAAMIPNVGVTINGAHRWLRLGPASLGLTFQPSEIVKWVMVFAIALWCARRPDRIASFRDGLLPPLLLVAAACLLIVKEDLGTAALVGAVAALLLLAAGAKPWHLSLVIPPAAAGLIVAVASSPYRLSRLTSFLDPWADPRGVCGAC
jgi:cell division protein FtsW